MTMSSSSPYVPITHLEIWGEKQKQNKKQPMSNH